MSSARKLGAQRLGQDKDGEPTGSIAGFPETLRAHVTHGFNPHAADNRCRFSLSPDGGEGTRHRTPNSPGFVRLLCGLLLLAGWLHLGAAEFSDPLEERDFTAAAKAFQDLNHERAEREFGEFIKHWPSSEFRAEAVLRQAQSRHARTNFTGAIDLLTAGLPQAGKLADQYQFLLGEAQFEAGQFAKAATTYALVVRDFTNSPHLLTAAHHEALARFKLGNQRAKVVSLLSDPNGAFQRAAKGSPTNSLVVNGTLLLGEALLAGQELPAAEQAARSLADRRLAPELQWTRDFLLGRVLFQARRGAEALNVATNLVRLASAINTQPQLAESFALQGSVLEQLGEQAAAVSSFTNNFTTNAPPELRRLALAKSVELNRKQNKHAETITMLEAFTAQYPRDPSLDIAQLTLGELRVKEFHGLAGGTNGPAQTNLLAMAVTNLSYVLQNYTNSQFAGQARYQRGWCYWHQGRPNEAAADFEAAVKLLPKNEDQAVARFKLGESQAMLKDYTSAMQNFALVVEQYGDLPHVKNTYFDQALYQQMSAAIAVTNLTVADDAVSKILNWFPDSFFSDRALLRYGTELNRMDKPGEARTKFQLLLDRFPKSTNAPQVHLAIAGTYRQEFDWTNTVRRLDEWVRLFPTNAAIADVEFERAYFSDRAGLATNAFQLYTNFVARFPAHTNAPLAQLLVGHFFFNQGQYDKAEASYQLLFQNPRWAASDLRYDAQMDAGRAAFLRQSYRDATNYFVALLNDDRVPKSIQAEAFFALGDTYLNAAQDRVLIATDPYGDAIIAFSRITNNFATNRLAPLAVARIGDCLLQRAGRDKDPKQLDLAAEAYQKAMTWPGADAVVRSRAELALGDAREKQGRTKDAADHWSNLLYLKNLRPEESPDLNSVHEAGVSLARLREEQRDWAGAIAIYQRLQEMFPARRSVFQMRIDRARQMLTLPK